MLCEKRYNRDWPKGGKVAKALCYREPSRKTELPHDKFKPNCISKTNREKSVSRFSNPSLSKQLNIKSPAKAGILIGLSVLVILPAAALARSGGDKVLRAPDVVVIENSQTMSLLEARHNINPVSGHGKELAIIDDSAIQSEGESGATFVDGGSTGSSQISVYIVRRGDTLPTIAKMFGVTPNTILWANNIPGGKIKEGTELVILPISGVKHIVKSGDNIQSIAKKYKADLDDVLSYNGISLSDKLAVGDVVLVPDGEINTPVPSSSSSISAKGIISGIKDVLGYFMRPVAGARKTQGIHGHNGVDLGASTGTNVMAAASGKIIVAKNGGWNGGYGSYVVVSHGNGTQTLYAHLSQVHVNVGEEVSQGESIGAVGSTGKSSGPHLHVEVRGARNPF